MLRPDKAVEQEERISRAENRVRASPYSFQEFHKKIKSHNRNTSRGHR